MQVQEIVRSQYHAALDMLAQVIQKCPEALWSHPADRKRTWEIAYHALFYTHLYLQKTLDVFRPWEKHRPGTEGLGDPPEGSPGQDQPPSPYSRDEVAEYLALCRQQVDEQTPQLDPEAGSGFFWLPMTKLELQFYNIRHLQQHTGELMERLGARAGVELDWVGMKKD